MGSELKYHGCCHPQLHDVQHNISKHLSLESLPLPIIIIQTMRPPFRSGMGGRGGGGGGRGGGRGRGRGAGRGDGGGRFQRDEGPPDQVVGEFLCCVCVLALLWTV